MALAATQTNRNLADFCSALRSGISRLCELGLPLVMFYLYFKRRLNRTSGSPENQSDSGFQTATFCPKWLRPPYRSAGISQIPSGALRSGLVVSLSPIVRRLLYPTLLRSRQSVNSSSCCSHLSSVVCCTILHCIPESR